MKITRKMIHPQLRLTGILLRLVLGGYSQSTLRRLSKITAAMGRKRAAKLRGMRFEPVFIDSSGHRLRLCVYRPLEEVTDTPALLWIHGGGYALGFPEQDEAFIRRFIKAVPCTVVAPDYRLSPEAPYPAALDDCMSALLWLRDNAAALGVRSDKIMVGGDSAGGGLAAALTIRARDEGRAAISYQMPLYPMLDDRMITESSRDNNAPVWNSRSNESAWVLYLGSLHRQEDVPPTAAPSRLEDFRGLPPAFTFVGSIEPFRDETIHYFEKLKAAGVNAEYMIFDGCYHAFDMMCPRSEPAKKAAAALLEHFAYAAENYSAPQPDSR